VRNGKPLDKATIVPAHITLCIKNRDENNREKEKTGEIIT
jgi:hypothetical protein